MNPAGLVGAELNNTACMPVAWAPGGAVGAGSGAKGIGTNGVVDRMPDITASVNYTDSWGHVAAAGVIRYFAVDNGGKGSNSLGATTSQTDDTLGGGLLAGATLNWGQWVGGYFAKDQIGFNGYWGEGINRYIEASSRQGDAILFITPSATPGASPSLSLKTQEQYGGFVWILHNWTDQLRTNVAFGIDQQDWKNGVTVSTAQGSQIERVESLHANLIWSPVKAVNIGVEYMWGYNEVRILASGAGVPGGS